MTTLRSESFWEHTLRELAGPLAIILSASIGSIAGRRIFHVSENAWNDAYIAGFVFGFFAVMLRRPRVPSERIFSREYPIWLLSGIAVMSILLCEAFKIVVH